ncbi:hypothetical protein Ngar_c13520 [Candidatus Nitrososphaera gargensis Ga9.2]|uniref:Uncharacterized protein n=2 Tax=Candidatus Nitrososphaera gargensis TaxID=497727 RepID=K0IEU9_NITGG|nr:hypothetical protein Ngar_c13520 [Candidatus Nitrososphaera gargensis Ga9.2]
MVDSRIKTIPDTVRFYRLLKRDPSLMLKEEGDFVFGYTWGLMIAGVASVFRDVQRQINEKEMDEAVQVLNSRMHQIRQAILNASKL